MEEYKRLSSEEIEKILAKEFPGFRCGQAKPAPVWLYGEGVNLSARGLHNICTDREMNEAVMDKKVPEARALSPKDHVGRLLQLREIVRKVIDRRGPKEDYAVVVAFTSDTEVVVRYEDGEQCGEQSHLLLGTQEVAPETLTIFSQQFYPDDIDHLELHDSFDRLRIRFAKKIEMNYTEKHIERFHKVLKAVYKNNPEAAKTIRTLRR